eukprot:Seg1682.5 transcript_id=Seg1682.5/GoldUCD/mRNA.D3Y31 product="Proton-coupled amino acid transporter 4" protein_id=Seg1682.5/GoldUCD/D3Y31
MINDTVYIVTKKIQKSLTGISFLVTESDNDERGAEEYSDEEEIEKEECEEKPLEEWQALMHLFKSFVGVGILGLPNGVMHGGILLGPIILLVLGLLCMHNLTLLTRTNKVVRERINVESLSYGELAEELLSLHKEWLGKLSKVLVDILVCMLQLGFCCVYFVFLSVTMHKIVKSIDQRAWMAMFLPLVLAASFIRNVNKLSYLISVGNAILGIGLAIILQYLIMHIKSPTRLPIGASPQSILIAFGQFVYGFEGVALLPALEKRMRDKDAFFRVIKVTALVITVLYMAFGVFGYLAFGQETKPSITLNLPDEPLYNALHGIYVIIVYITYPVQFFAAVDILKPILEDRFEKSSLVAAEYGLRTVLVLLTCE